MHFMDILKKTFEDTKLLHRFIHEQSPILREDIPPKIDQKNYNNLQVAVLKKIAELKFGGNIQKFITSPEAKKAMGMYREFVNSELPFLLTSDNNPAFNYKDEAIIDKASSFIIAKLFPKVAQVAY
jgi:hypothetical protein